MTDQMDTKISQEKEIILNSWRKRKIIEESRGTIIVHFYKFVFFFPRLILGSKFAGILLYGYHFYHSRWKY